MSSVEFAFPQQSPANETANSVTHGIGCVLATFFSLLLLYLASDTTSAVRLGLVVYVASLIAVYAFSTLSHAIQDPDSKLRLRAWDQGTIYLLIAGTYTPLLIQFLPPTRCLIVLAIMWTAACLGCYAKVAARHRVNSLMMRSYLALGWFPLFTFLGHVPPSNVVTWVGNGAIGFMIGAMFLKFDQRVNFFHAIWHLCVMIGTGCHLYAISQAVANV